MAKIFRVFQRQPVNFFENGVMLEIFVAIYEDNIWGDQPLRLRKRCHLWGEMTMGVSKAVWGGDSLQGDDGNDTLHGECK